MRALEASTEESRITATTQPLTSCLGLVNHEIISYVFFGLLTTVVSMVSFYLFNELLGKDPIFRR